MRAFVKVEEYHSKTMLGKGCTMAIINKITPDEAKRINKDLRETKDFNHPIRRPDEGETFWGIAFAGFDAIDASDSRGYMYEE